VSVSSEKTFGDLQRRSWLMTATLICVVSIGMWQGQARGADKAPETSASSATSVPLVYVSDYFSFIGKDQHGWVAFALDNNRGQDGETWQAEHFVVLHDQQRGWVKMVGGGKYPNPNRALATIPDSTAFQFQGTPTDGIVIASLTNGLRLNVKALPHRLQRQTTAGYYWMGSAEATLEWEGRVLQGRVIYEYLRVPNFNRLTRSYPGLWKEFHGLYAWVEGGGDLYIHSQQSPLLQSVVGNLTGFAVLNGETLTLDHLTLSVQERQHAIGTYSWPMAWQGGWGDTSSPTTFTVTLSDRKTISNWGIGGFAMGIIQGHLTHNGRTLSLYGFGELLI
jgi:hypothetical protein